MTAIRRNRVSLSSVSLLVLTVACQSGSGSDPGGGGAWTAAVEPTHRATTTADQQLRRQPIATSRELTSALAHRVIQSARPLAIAD